MLERRQAFSLVDDSAKPRNRKDDPLLWFQGSRSGWGDTPGPVGPYGAEGCRQVQMPGAFWFLVFGFLSTPGPRHRLDLLATYTLERLYCGISTYPSYLREPYSYFPRSVFRLSFPSTLGRSAKPLLPPFVPTLTPRRSPPPCNGKAHSKASKAAL
jgi:hypothetical protein